jgi:hypothetical protein
VASASRLTLWAPPSAHAPADPPAAALAAVSGSRACLSLLPPLASLSAGVPCEDELGGWRGYGAHARDAADDAPALDGEAAGSEAAASDAEFAVVAFGGGQRRASGAEPPAEGVDGGAGGELDGGLLFAGCTDGRVFAFALAGPRSAPRLQLRWARRLPAPPLGGALTSCAVVSLCANRPSRAAHARLAVCDGAGRLWLWHADEPTEPAQLAVPVVAPSGGRRGRKPVLPKLKTVVMCARAPIATPEKTRARTRARLVTAAAAALRWPRRSCWSRRLPLPFAAPATLLPAGSTRPRTPPPPPPRPHQQPQPQPQPQPPAPPLPRGQPSPRGTCGWSASSPPRARPPGPARGT